MVLTPFIGGGVGFAQNTISNFTDQGTTTAGRSDAALCVGSVGSKWNFAWALHTGLAYKVAPNLTFEFGYSFVNLGDAMTGNCNQWTASAPPTMP